MKTTSATSCGKCAAHCVLQVLATAPQHWKGNRNACRSSLRIGRDITLDTRTPGFISRSPLGQLLLPPPSACVQVCQINGPFPLSRWIGQSSLCVTMDIIFMCATTPTLMAVVALAWMLSERTPPSLRVSQTSLAHAKGQAIHRNASARVGEQDRSAWSSALVCSMVAKSAALDRVLASSMSSRRKPVADAKTG